MLPPMADDGLRRRALAGPARLAALLAAAALVAGRPRPGHADPAGRTVLLFVPELDGALDFGVEARSAIERFALTDTAPAATPTVVAGHLGYRRYLEPHGRVVLGGYLAAGIGTEQPGRVSTVHLDAGVALHLRAVSPDFFYWVFGGFAEAGPVLPRGDRGAGLRWAVGLESGPGLLWFLDPYLFADVTGRIGVQSIRLAGVEHTALFAGLRMSFDLAHR